MGSTKKLRISQRVLKSNTLFDDYVIDDIFDNVFTFSKDEVKCYGCNSKGNNNKYRSIFSYSCIHQYILFVKILIVEILDDNRKGDKRNKK